ncbi:hypothetical protein [Salmonella phage SSBI34]|nr:hypothetical protein [Salmonella phage SSBI34]
MSVDSKQLNSVYALAKGKDGKFQVGMWANQSLFAVDGSNKRLASFKDMTKWRYFREATEYVSDVELKQGDRVSGGKDGWYYVIYESKETDGKFHYVVGF